MDEQKKRKSSPSGATSEQKKQKKPWHNSHQHKKAASIEPGDAGIWATCARGKEGKSTADLRDLFDDYAARLHPQSSSSREPATESKDVDDIEASISAEVSAIKSTDPANSDSTGSHRFFETVRIETQCVLFFKTFPPIEPVSFVERICQDKATGKAIRGCKFVKRLTPMTCMGRANQQGLENVCSTVLREETLGSRGKGVKYAIRPTIREHNVMKRDEIIQQVAKAVGDGYVVDLKKPDVVVLVEVYRGVLGMSVVGGEFERLKRFNLAEIEEPPEQSADKRGEKKAEVKDTDLQAVDTEESKV